MTSRALRRLALGAGLTLLPFLRADDRQPPPLVMNAPVKNWALPLFTEEGNRQMTLRGTQAQAITAEHIDIVDMNITVFSRDSAERVDTIILSPSASYFPHENRATGPGRVRLIDYRYALEVQGDQWVYTYDRDGKKISLARNVQVVIHAPLPDFLK